MKRIDGLDGLQLPSKHEKKIFERKLIAALELFVLLPIFFFFLILAFIFTFSPPRAYFLFAKCGSRAHYQIHRY